MKRTWTIIGLSDVPSSFKWYQTLFGHTTSRSVRSLRPSQGGLRGSGLTNSESTGEPYIKTEHDSSGMIGLGHVGMYAKDPASLAEFYRDVMGMQVVGGSDAKSPIRSDCFPEQSSR
jgi:hypothetical protein